jgi:hypothetical protein
MDRSRIAEALRADAGSVRRAVVVPGLVDTERVVKRCST